MKRKSRSPKEIKSLFDDIACQKKDGGQSPAGTSSILDAVPTQEKNSAQQPRHAPAPERSDYTAREPPIPSPETSATPKRHMPLWTRPEAASPKQPKADTAMKATHRQPFWRQTWDQIENTVITPKPGVSTKRQKTMMMLVPVLFTFLIVVLTQLPFAPPSTRIGTSNLVVKGILYNQEDPAAIVNNRIVHEGDEISGATIIKINKQSVEFEVKKWWSKKARRFTKEVRR